MLRFSIYREISVVVNKTLTVIYRVKNFAVRARC